MKRRDFAQALTNVLTRYLVQRRRELLRQLDQTGWQWNRVLSLELEQVDDALTRLGEFYGESF